MPSYIHYHIMWKSMNMNSKNMVNLHQKLQFVRYSCLIIFFSPCCASPLRCGTIATVSGGTVAVVALGVSMNERYMMTDTIIPNNMGRSSISPETTVTSVCIIFIWNPKLYFNTTYQQEYKYIYLSIYLSIYLYAMTQVPLLREVAHSWQVLCLKCFWEKD